MSEFAALIPNWNGAETLERLLASVLAAGRVLGAPLRILVVDDASKDGSLRLMRDLFPEAEVLPLPSNRGFAEAVNAGMERLAGCPWVFLLNNDLALAPDFFARLRASRDRLADPDLFMIGARTVDWTTGEPNHGGMNAEWNGSLIVQAAFDSEELAPSDFIQAGACLVDRAKFAALGGFSGLYSPAYWEDYDIAYQARRRGWRNYYEPRAVAHHWGRKSMTAAFGPGGVARMLIRNQLIFNWANLHDGALLARHLVGLGPLMLRGPKHAFSAGKDWPGALRSALPMLPSALRARRARRAAGKVSDREILFSRRGHREHRG